MGETVEERVKYVDNIIKSPEDKRLYKALELKNKLKVLIISDPDTDKSAASLDVCVGSLSDPDELPGLAHFCEHMLFLGTEKYPCENEYNKFLSEHGGGSNAATSSEHTTYYFDVVPEHFEGALDRFAQFFLCPLFTVGATEREVNAVHSEHEKNISNDSWRLDQLEKSTSKKNHPYRKFGTGNKSTLVTIPKEKGIDVREELLKFHKKWYSTNIMTLAILGKESLEDLENLTLSLFSNVENKNVKRPEWTDHPFGPEQLRVRGYVVPVKDLRNLNISFPIPDLHEHYKSGPSIYISHLVGHEGPGGLLSALKAKGWCNNLVAGSRTGAKGFAFFNINVDLTEEGMEKIDEIVTLVFQYLNLLRETGPQKWIFEEYQQTLKTAYRFKDKENPRSYVSRVVHNLHEYPLEEVLSGPYHLEEWRPDLIEMVLGYLKPANIRVAVIGQKFEPDADQVEPWYGSKYKLEKIPDAIIVKWETCSRSNELRLPNVNEFITSNFEILYSDDKRQNGSPHPSIIQESVLTRVWFKQDDEFLLPKANLKFEFVSPLAYLDPLNCDLTYMYIQLLKDALNEYAYDAELAGLRYEIITTKYGMLLAVGGYNDKQNVLLDKVLEKMTNFKIDRQRFIILKENYIRSLKNFEAEQPYQQAMYYLSLLIAEQAWSKEELLEATEEMTIERMEEFIPQLWSKLHVECLIHGNVDKDRALALIKILEDRLKSRVAVRPLLPQQLLRNREIQLVDGSHFMYEMPNQYHKSSCTEAYYQCCMQSTENNMLMELLVQVLNEPCFNILRTKEQLGYLVFSGVRRSNCVQGLRVIVQSDKHPSYIDQRIEAFLIQVRDMISEMSTEEFERHKEALAAIRLEKPKRLSNLSARFWNEISSQQYHFTRAEDEVAYLRTIGKNDLLRFFDDYIKYDAPQRHKLSVHVLSQIEGGAGTLPEPDADFLSSSIDGLFKPPPYKPPTKIEDVTKFKSSHGLYPLVQPYINIATINTKSKL